MFGTRIFLTESRNCLPLWTRANCAGVSSPTRWNDSPFRCYARLGYSIEPLVSSAAIRAHERNRIPIHY